jgi:hypothetical protein
MDIVNDKLDLFIPIWSKVPLLRDVFSEDKLDFILDKSNRYQITEEERSKIIIFPFDLIRYGTNLAFEVENELDLNIERCFQTEFHLKNYLQSVYNKMNYIMDSIRTLNFINKLEEYNFLLPTLHGLDEIEVQNSKLLIDFLQSHLINYQNHQMVLNYVMNKQQEFDFFAITKDIPKQISKETNNIRSSFNLQSQFANSEKYHEVIKKLIVTQNLRMDKEGNLIFIPISRKNAQYEAVTLFEALKKSGLLKNRERTYEEIGKILSNTFKDWNLSVRTIGDKKTFTRLEDYEAIIS